MVPSSKPVECFFVFFKTCGVHGFTEGSVIACHHVKVRRHESAICMDRRRGTADQHCVVSSGEFVSGKSVSQWREGRKVFAWQGHQANFNNQLDRLVIKSSC